MNESPVSVPRTRECVGGDLCAMNGAGHELHAIQRVAAAATASLWQDALVTAVSADGSVELVDVFTEERTLLWHHRDLTDEVHVGDAVSYHARYDVLAIAGDWISVARASETRLS